MPEALIFEAPYQISVQSMARPVPGAGELLVETHRSAVSAGTELLAYRGQLPAGLPLDSTIEALAGESGRYPLRFGYAAAGRVIAAGPGADPAWLDRLVFAFHPHQSHFTAPQAGLIPIPPDIDLENALFLPNMETAVSLVMDGRPVIGERVLVLGLGIVGLLTTALLADLPLAALIGVDRYPLRRETALALGGTAAFAPDESPAAALGEADLTFELSGDPAALDLAIAHTGFDGRVLIGSWYGDKRATIDLGGRFHRSHLRLISSQVSQLHPRWRGRWTQARRLDVAWEMIRRLRPARLITHRRPLPEAPALYDLLDRRPEEALQTVFTYLPA